MIELINTPAPVSFNNGFNNSRPT